MYIQYIFSKWIIWKAISPQIQEAKKNDKGTCDSQGEKAQLTRHDLALRAIRDSMALLSMEYNPVNVICVYNVYDHVPIIGIVM